MKTKKSAAVDLVFVSLYVSLGDADGSIEGYRVMPKTEWDEDVAKFQTRLEAKGITAAYNEGEWGGYEVDLENYATKPITVEEAAVITKFLGKSPGDFRLPTEFLGYEEEEEEEDDDSDDSDDE